MQADELLALIRAEYTVLPRFAYHQPLDYAEITYPPAFEAPVMKAGVELPLPPIVERMGYSADDEQYLEWGRYDHDLIVGRANERRLLGPGSRILDLGCSSGRVLRHFRDEQLGADWQIYGVDAQARPIEWLRRHFPLEFQVSGCTVLPHLPFEDNSFDVIFGISVFTHIKYLWDAWLLELRRIIRPGGIILQTIHAESAWEFYNQNYETSDWISKALPAEIYQAPQFVADYCLSGDISNSQTFWRAEVAERYWSRYFDRVTVHRPSERFSFQDMIVAEKRR